MKKKEALGRGLDALLGEVSEAYENESSSQDGVIEIPLSEIEPNPYQPRKHFSSESLKELAESIKEDGLIQPIIVQDNGLDGYTIVAGERRYRASKLAKQKTIKAIIVDISDEQMQQYALIENIQREDLNPVELAQSYQKLLELHDMTHEELSSVIHKSRTHITNTLRLLQLSESTQKALVDKKISAGHAKMLVGLDEKDQTLVVNSIIGQKLSVREVENLIKGMKGSSGSKATQKDSKQRTETLDLSSLENELKRFDIKTKTSSNKITLEFHSSQQIQSLVEKLSSKN
ncbi:MAG: ParB/RepB/Spo0J family partition protein [Epsilonproteobacteria bacterium]|nr:ParB/RepB/Spo0J family partition protein [Campylobacterota bacterium]